MLRTSRVLSYQPAFDGLRALAVVAVILQHSWFAYIPGGWVGVDLFFVLSGFLITSLLLQEQSGIGRISLRAFYLRRAARLWPAFAVFLGVYFAMTPITTNGVSRATWLHQGAIAGTYWFNIYMAGHPNAIGSISHTWSFGLEEQFYLLWPVFLVILHRLRVSRRMLLVATALLICACIERRLLLYFHGATWQRMVYPPDTRMDACLSAAAQVNSS